MKNVFYMHKISAIGGVESFFYYLSKIYKDFVVYYKEGNPEQIKRLAQNVEVHKYTKPIKCDRFFCSYGFDIEVEAKEYYHIIHYDPLNVGFAPMINKDFKYIGVSKVACKGWKEKTGLDCELIYNPVPIEKPNVKKKPGLHIIVLSRLTSEKGGENIEKLANLIEKRTNDFDITVYTNKTKYPFRNTHIITKEQQLDLKKEVSESTFLAQLSKTESFGLSVCESLILGTPVIITPLEAFKEIGCIHGKNAVICDFNMNNVDVDMIINGIPEFDYKPPKETWNKYLSKESTYNPNELVEVRTIRRIYLLEENMHLKRHEKIKVTRARASYLESLNYVEVL